MDDFAKMLKQELGRVNGNGGGSGSGEKTYKETLYKLRKKKPLYISKKNPFLGRILSLGTNRWFATEINEIEFTIKTSKGLLNFHPAVYRDGNKDSLSEMVWEVMKFNSNYRKEHKVEENPIMIKEKGVGVGFPGTSISTSYEIIGIPSDANGNLMTNEDGTYLINNYLVSGPIYRALVNLLGDNSYRIDNQPLKQGFLTQTKTYAVQIKYDGTHMNVMARPDIIYPSMDYNYLQRNQDNTDFVYFDDPKKYNVPIVDYDPDFHSYLEAMMSSSIMNKSKPYNVILPAAQKYYVNNNSNNDVANSVPVSNKPVEPTNSNPSITVDEGTTETLPWEQAETAKPEPTPQSVATSTGEVAHSEVLPWEQTPAQSTAPATTSGSQANTENSESQGLPWDEPEEVSDSDTEDGVKGILEQFN